MQTQFIQDLFMYFINEKKIFPEIYNIFILSTFFTSLYTVILYFDIADWKLYSAC